MWHARYDEDGTLRRRLEIVQRHIRRVLDEHTRSPLRVISMCAGQGRDLLGALDAHPRRDIVGCLVELNPELAADAQQHVDALGLAQLCVVVGDAGEAWVYRPFAPADLVLECGLLGNISDADVERTLRASAALCAPGATLIWTRHRRPPDLTVAIRDWLAAAGFENLDFEAVDDPERQGAVGVARFIGPPRALIDEHLFTFSRDRL